MLGKESPEKAQSKQAYEPNPIEYLGGVMDEETRPLLKSYIEGLKEGEGALVVFRLLEGDSPDMLLESNITQIAGHGWNYVAGKDGDSAMQKLVDKLSEDAMRIRVANTLVSQGDAKIKAYDAHKICFGLIGKSDEEITSIKGIVHQQLNMGLNGDLLLHEGDIIMQSLIDNGVFNDGDRQRPIQVQTYGAGGSASEAMNPGVMAVSDGVIDIRTHVDPRSTMIHLAEYCKNHRSSFPGVDDEKWSAFNEQMQIIEDKMKDEPDYSGIAMVHDMAELARRAASYTGKTTIEIMETMDSRTKRYIGEITFGTPYYGTTVVSRLSANENDPRFSGDDGQKNLIKELQKFITNMGKVNPEEQEKAADSLLKKQNNIQIATATNIVELAHFLKWKFEGNESIIVSGLIDDIKELFDKNNTFMKSIFREPHNFSVNAILKENIENNSNRIHGIVEQLIERMDAAAHDLGNSDKQDYELRKSRLLALEGERFESNKAVLTTFNEQTRLREIEFDYENSLNKIEDLTEQKLALTKKNFTKEQALDFEIATLTMNHLYKENEKAVDELLKAEHGDTKVINALMARIGMNDVLIKRYEAERNDLLNSGSVNLTVNKETYDDLDNQINSLRTTLAEQSKTLDEATRQHSALVNADRKLRFSIDKSKSIHNEVHPDSNFSITACGNIFFTEDDKSAVGKYGAKLVEMENSLFVEIIHRSIANQLYIDKQHITKIAADPLKIEDHVSDKLNEWASTYTMSVGDYVDAFMWANAGQPFDAFPDSGRWTVAEELFNSDPVARSRFYNFGTEDDVKIVNPFWKEIGTDLVKEIKDGKAFLGAGFKHMNFDKDPLLAKRLRLKDMASKIIENPAVDDIEDKVRALFTDYLILMEPMQVQRGQDLSYRCYARNIPVLKKGFVCDVVPDWDQPIYKSSNTALLDNQAASFLALQGGQTLGAGRAMTLHSEVTEEKNIESGNVVLFKMLKAERAGNHAELLAIGKKFLKNYNEPAEPTGITPAEKKEFDNTINAMRVEKAKIENMVDDHTKGYPHALDKHVRMKKITGPRVAHAIEEIRKEEGPGKALRVAEKFLAWKATTNHNYNVQDIKKMLPGLRAEAGIKTDVGMKEKLKSIKGDVEEMPGHELGTGRPVG